LSVTLDFNTLLGLPSDCAVGRLELCVTGSMSVRELLWRTWAAAVAVDTEEDLVGSGVMDTDPFLYFRPSTLELVCITTRATPKLPLDR